MWEQSYQLYKMFAKSYKYQVDENVGDKYNILITKLSYLVINVSSKNINIYLRLYKIT